MASILERLPSKAVEFLDAQAALTQDTSECANGNFTPEGYHNGYESFISLLGELDMTAAASNFDKAGRLQLPLDLAER